MSRIAPFLALCVAIAAVTAAMAQTVGDLRCEYLRDPLGIDALKPRLSWILQSDRRGTSQTAFRILVASSPELLERNKGDLWDSGKVVSVQSNQVEYAGAPLQSREICWWKVRVWDDRVAPTMWSEPAHWEMGLLKPEDWQAKWIDAPTAISGEPIHGKLSILKASYEAIDGAAGADVTAQVAKLLRNNSLTVPVSNDVLGGDPARLHPKQLRVTYAIDGTQHETVAGEWTTLVIPGNNQRSLPYLRKDFTLGKPVAKARLYATALGLYELRLNGSRVGDHLFAPDWTDYARRVRYQVYDITSLVKQGGNTLGALAGDGWYSGHIGNGGFRAWGKVPALFAQLEVTFADGSTQCVTTDATWKMHPGPILSSDIMLGENYDARLEIAGWDKPGLDTSKWSAATERTEKPRPLDGQVDEPVRQTAVLHPKSMAEPKPGRWTYDFGQNLVGVVSMRISCPAGTKITLRHAEMLDANGSIYTANLRAASATDTYICKGGGEETWQPRFTFHGFRYVEVSGLLKAPANDAVTAIVMGTDIRPAGQFACSSPEINQLQSNIQWGMRGNYLSVPTDCPQRDERLGWMGDAEVFVRTAAYNGDIAPFFTKWLVDVDDAQSPEGAFTDVSPSPYGGGGTPAWGDAGVICPWTIYLMYGDKRILEEHLPAMMRWVDWCEAHSAGLIRVRNRGGDYGDWLSQGEQTSKELIGTAFFAHSASLVAQACRITGNIAAADKYQELCGQIKAAFDERYLNPDGSLQNGTQTAYCLALGFDFLPGDLRAGAGQFLAEDIKARGYHLTTGFVGVGRLLPALSMANEMDAAYRVFQQDTFPSWLFSVKQGATTIWERWDGWTPDKGFQDPGMNSFNHYSLGSCGEWMFETVAGIDADPTQPGFKHTIIRPRPGGTLTHAEAHYDSIYGKISTKWRLENGVFSLQVSIPPNTTATVTLPTTNSASVRESGSAVAAHPEIKSTPDEATNARYLIGSGDYDFTCKVP